MSAIGGVQRNFSAARVGWLVTALGSLAVGLVCCFRPLRDFDLPWNLATGRIIWEGGSIPVRDDLAFTKGLLRYVEVLGDTALYQVHEWGGELALQVVAALTLTALLVVVAARVRIAGPVGMLAVGSIAAGVGDWFELRPATLSFTAMALLLLLLEQHRAHPERDWPLMLLVPLQLVWANVHGFAALGAAWIVGYLGYRTIARLQIHQFKDWFPPRDGMALPASAGWAAFAVAATCLNTAGPSLLLGPFRFDENFGGITEWATPDRQFFLQHQPVGAAILVLGIIAFALGREEDGNRTPCAFECGQLLLALGAALTVVRFLPLALIIVLPLAARRFASYLRPAPLVSFACGLAPLLAAGWLALKLPLSSTPGFDRSWHPVAAVEFINRAKPRGQMYNFMPFGGYLAWRLHPDHRVFHDGRNQLARGADFLRAVRLAQKSRTTFHSMLAEYNVQWAIERAPAVEQFGAAFASSRDWRMVYWDDVAAVYVRSMGPNNALASVGYQVLTHLTPLPQILDLALNGTQRSGALANDSALATAQAPKSSRAAFIAACAGIATGNALETEHAIGQLARLSPDHPAVAVLQQAWLSIANRGTL